MKPVQLHQASGKRPSGNAWMLIRVWVTGEDGWLCINTWHLRGNLGLMLNNMVWLSYYDLLYT